SVRRVRVEPARSGNDATDLTVTNRGRPMADELTTRDAKLIQYLNEAYGKEKELETALQAHIKMAKRPPYKKRLQEHLRETQAQSTGLDKRIEPLRRNEG